MHKTVDRAITFLAYRHEAVERVSFVAGKIVARLDPWGVAHGEGAACAFLPPIDDNGPRVFTPLYDYAKGSRTE